MGKVPKKVRIVGEITTPATAYLTVGKVYDVLPKDPRGQFQDTSESHINLIDDEGDYISPSFPLSMHLGAMAWFEAVEYA